MDNTVNCVLKLQFIVVGLFYHNVSNITSVWLNLDGKFLCISEDETVQIFA